MGCVNDIAKKIVADNQDLVTGHYARVEQDAATGRWLLKKGLDEGKDQSLSLIHILDVQSGLGGANADGTVLQRGGGAQFLLGILYLHRC